MSLSRRVSSRPTKPDPPPAKKKKKKKKEAIQENAQPHTRNQLAVRMNLDERKEMVVIYVPVFLILVDIIHIKWLLVRPRYKKVTTIISIFVKLVMIGFCCNR